VRWKDGSTSSKALKDLKESNPVEVAEYAVGAKLVSEPAFAWGVPFTLKRRERIIAKIDSQFAKKTHTFGIAVPSTVNDALQMDKENGNTMWWDSIKKEMRNVRVAFNILDDNENLPPALPLSGVNVLSRDANEGWARIGGLTEPSRIRCFISFSQKLSTAWTLPGMARNGDAEFLLGATPCSLT
jgi:hypothetical protein